MDAFMMFEATVLPMKSYLSVITISKKCQKAMQYGAVDFYPNQLILRIDECLKKLFWWLRVSTSQETPFRRRRLITSIQMSIHKTKSFSKFWICVSTLLHAFTIYHAESRYMKVIYIRLISMTPTNISLRYRLKQAIDKMAEPLILLKDISGTLI